MNHSSLLWNFPLRTPCWCAQRFLERSESQEFAQLVKASLVSCVWDVHGMPSGHCPSWWIVRQAEKSQSVFIGCSPCARHNSTCFAKAKAFSLRGKAMATALSSTLSDDEGSECRQQQFGLKTHGSKSRANWPILTLQTPRAFEVAPAHLSLPISFLSYHKFWLLALVWENYFPHPCAFSSSLCQKYLHPPATLCLSIFSLWGQSCRQRN